MGPNACILTFSGRRKSFDRADEAIAYFGASRSGNVSSIINPYLTPDRLAHGPRNAIQRDPRVLEAYLGTA